MSNQFTIVLIVANHFGVLHRITGLYSKRGYNIDTLAVGETENHDFSRMSIVSTGDEYMRDQVVKQLEKLHDVKYVNIYDGKIINIDDVMKDIKDLYNNNKY